MTTKGKLLVAGAGDVNTDVTTGSFPAAFSSGYAFSGGVAAVAASGSGSGSNFNYNCRAGFSDYGNWITLAAPGRNIYSTMPWDKYFGLYAYSFSPRYDYMSSTAIASAFAAAAAARAWGYQPALTAAGVVQRLQATGTGLDTSGGCWPPAIWAALPWSTSPGRWIAGPPS